MHTHTCTDIFAKRAPPSRSLAYTNPLHVCECMYDVCVCVYIYIYIYTHSVCIYIYIYIYIHTHTHTYTHSYRDLCRGSTP